MKAKVEKTWILIAVLLISMALMANVPSAVSNPGEIQIVHGVFQPVQVVLQDDPLYPPNDMQDWGVISGNLCWLANFHMVERKNTFLFGTFADLDGNPSTINVDLKDLDDPPGIDIFRIQISVCLMSPPGGPERVIYESPYDFIPRGGFKSVKLNAPIPESPFMFKDGPGAYEIRLRTIDTPSINLLIVATEAVDTEPLQLYYIPYAFEGDHAPGVELPVGKRLDDMVRESNAFVVGTYPLSETRSLSEFEEKGLRGYLNPPWDLTAPNPSSNETKAWKYLLEIMKQFNELGNIIQADSHIRTQIVVVVPSYKSTESKLWARRWFNLDSPGDSFYKGNMPNVVFVELGYWTTVAHEITHNILKVGHSDNKANGYWVNRNKIQFLKRDLMNATGFPDNLHFYENNNARWIKKRAADNDPDTHHDVSSSFEDLLNRFKKDADPETLVVRGQVFKNGTVALDDWYRFPNGLPNLELGTTGNCSVVMLDSMGQELGRAGFNATFTFEMGDLEPPELIDADVSPFGFIIPWISGTSVIEIRDAAENVLATRYVSANPPSVSVTFPNGGEVLAPGLYNITWTANDLDGDPLKYTILYSDNNGTNWLPMAMDLEQTSYTWNTTALSPGSKYLVKVIATDGVNTGEDVSDGNFTIAGHDVAVTNVTPSKTVVGQGYPTAINVSVENKGTFDETFNVTLYVGTGTPPNETGLVGYWKFDEGSGTTANDSSGYNNHGTLYNDPAWIKGKIGKALNFDGVDDYVNVPDSPSLDITNNLTVEAWVYPRSYGTKTPDEWGQYHAGIVSKSDFNDQTYKLTFALSNATHTHLYFEINNMTSCIGLLSDAISPKLNEWHHIAGVYDGNYIRIYLDGSEIASKYIGYIVCRTNDQSLKIGRDAYASSGRRFDGFIDEVRVYNRTLSKEEITADMSFFGKIGTEVITLASGNSTALTFTWNTAGFAKGNYTISAYAWPVQGETNFDYNNCTDGSVTVTKVGDFGGGVPRNSTNATIRWTVKT